MEKKLSKIETKVCNIPDDILTTLQQDIAEIKVALLGNEYNPQGGLLYRVSDLEKHVDRLKNKYERIMWTIVVASSVIAFVFNVIMQMWDKVIK